MCVAFLLSPIVVNATTTTPVPKVEVHRNIQTLSRIRKCESGGNDLARNPHSSAKGRYQFLDGTWAYYGKKLWGQNWVTKDVLNGDHQQELAEYVAVNFGLKDWDASYGCWGY